MSVENVVRLEKQSVGSISGTRQMTEVYRHYFVLQPITIITGLFSPFFDYPGW